MLETIMNDVIAAVTGVFQGASPAELGVLGAVALLSGGTMSSFGQWLGRSGLAVVLLGLANIGLDGFMSPDRFTGGEWMGQLQTAWDYAMNVSGGDLLGYFGVFLVSNIVLFGGKSLLVR
jgi:hypothetical protein